MDFHLALQPLLHHASLPSGVVLEDGPHTMLALSWDRVERLRDRRLQEGTLGAIVNEMGKASAHAQGLKQVITSLSKFTRSSDRIYLHCTLPSTVNGLLRVGEKRLFIRDELGAIKEITPSCVLDFYVHESKQRSGVGRQLFEFMLSHEKAAIASKFGYDRPSPKLLAFLAKHYELSNYVPQNNNFVVFRKYFSKDQPPSSSGSRDWKNTSANSNAVQAVSQPPPSHSSQPSRSSYAPFPGASPPPGQASFAHWDPSEEEGKEAARSLEYGDVPRGSERSQPVSSPSNGRYSTTSASTYAAQPSPSGRDERDSGSRLARAGSNVLSSNNLHQQPQQQQQRGPPSSSAAQNFQSPFSPTHQSRSSSSQQFQTNSPTNQPRSQPDHAYPPQRVTQYHQHNILTGYQQSTGHGTFANAPKQPANFLPDGMQLPQEIPVERKTTHAGIQRRPLLDPFGHGVKQLDRSISHLESSIAAKEAALASGPKYEIPYRQPSHADAGWSKAGSYQRMQAGNAAGLHPTHVSMATPHSENHSQYSNPSQSNRIGGAMSEYRPNAPSQPVAFLRPSPFAYGAVRRQ
jgi:GNAT superfamily N-acetyltransferase